MFKWKPVEPLKYGWLEIVLDKEPIDYLKKIIKNKKQKSNHTLAGNITQSNFITDENNWFMNNVVNPCIDHYIKEFGEHFYHKYLMHNCAMELDKFWVNFQQKYEFNPMHNHTGVFSFVVWIDIPTNWVKEHNVSFSKGSNRAVASDFCFVYTDILGRLRNYWYKLNQSQNGTMLFFPAELQHQVYPFYTSNKNRVSVSGNISLNPLKVVPNNVQKR